MMRVLRTTLWRGMGDADAMAVMRDSDLIDTVESVLLHLVDAAAGTLMTYDIFDMPDGDSMAATLKAVERLNEVVESHQSVLYFYVVSQWRILASGGTMFSTEAAPLSVEQVRLVLEQLAKHPEYQDYTYLITAQDGTPVRLTHGEVQDG